MSNKKENIIYIPKSKTTKESITIYGAGKFGEESLTLCPARAAMLISELLVFISKSTEDK
jgi:hypothetical protein